MIDEVEALKGPEAIFAPGLPYARAGVLLFDLPSSKVRQGSLLDLSLVDRDLKREKLMRSIDSINDRYALRLKARLPNRGT